MVKKTYHFITRIELINPQSNDYDKLHENMKLEGFSKTIKTSKGNEYNLPDAEYYFSIEVSDDEIVFVEDILELAKQATGKKDNEYRAMTSELANNDSLKWHNFTLVESKKK